MDTLPILSLPLIMFPLLFYGYVFYEGLYKTKRLSSIVTATYLFCPGLYVLLELLLLTKTRKICKR